MPLISADLPRKYLTYSTVLKVKHSICPQYRPRCFRLDAERRIFHSGNDGKKNSHYSAKAVVKTWSLSKTFLRIFVIALKIFA